MQAHAPDADFDRDRDHASAEVQGPRCRSQIQLQTLSGTTQTEWAVLGSTAVAGGATVAGASDGNGDGGAAVSGLRRRLQAAFAYETCTEEQGVVRWEEPMSAECDAECATMPNCPCKQCVSEVRRRTRTGGTEHWSEFSGSFVYTNCVTLQTRERYQYVPLYAIVRFYYNVTLKNRSYQRHDVVVPTMT